MKRLTPEQKFQKVIVVDEETGMPMVWEDGQFVFAIPISTTSVKCNGPAVVLFTRYDALFLIRSNNQTRKKAGLSQNGFKLVLARNGKG